jgi:hypothetical protein
MPATSGTLVTTGGAQTIEFADGSASAPSITNSGDTNTGMFFPAADTIAFTEGGVESMRIDSSGNLGLGTTSPSQRLQISNSSGSVISLAERTSPAGAFFVGHQASDTINTFRAGLDNSLTYAPIGTTSNFPVGFITNNTERMRITTAGDVGIGTTNPGTILELKAATPVLRINGTSQASARGIVFQDNGTTRGSLFHNSDSGATTLSSGDAGSGFFLAFRTDNAERMRIVNNNGTRFACENFANTPSSTNWGVELNNTSSGSRFYGQGSGTETQIEFGNRNGQRGSIQTTSGGTSYNTTSDYRLKENVVPMVGALTTISALKPCTYTWKVDGSDGQGFIAHELAEVVPDCVSGEKDAVDENGDIKPQCIDTSFLVATLTAAIQELKATVDAQAARIAALEGAK